MSSATIRYNGFTGHVGVRDGDLTPLALQSRWVLVVSHPIQ